MVRPNVPEVVHGLSVTLARSVLPLVAEPYVQAQLRYTLSVLDSIGGEWDGAADRLVRENEELRYSCRAIRALCATGGSDALARCLPALEQVLELPLASDLRLSTRSERNDRLWGALIGPLELAVAGDLAAELETSLKAELQPLLRRYTAGRRMQRTV